MAMATNFMRRVLYPEQEDDGEDGEDGEGPGEHLVQPVPQGRGLRMEIFLDQPFRKT